RGQARGQRGRQVLQVGAEGGDHVGDRGNDVLALEQLAELALLVAQGLSEEGLLALGGGAGSAEGQGIARRDAPFLLAALDIDSRVPLRRLDHRGAGATGGGVPGSDGGLRRVSG